MPCCSFRDDDVVDGRRPGSAKKLKNTSIKTSPNAPRTIITTRSIAPADRDPNNPRRHYIIIDEGLVSPEDIAPLNVIYSRLRERSLGPAVYATRDNGVVDVVNGTARFGQNGYCVVEPMPTATGGVLRASDLRPNVKEVRVKLSSLSAKERREVEEKILAAKAEMQHRREAERRQPAAEEATAAARHQSAAEAFRAERAAIAEHDAAFHEQRRLLSERDAEDEEMIMTGTSTIPTTTTTTAVSKSHRGVRNGGDGVLIAGPTVVKPLSPSSPDPPPRVIATATSTTRATATALPPSSYQRQLYSPINDVVEAPPAAVAAHHHTSMGPSSPSGPPGFIASPLATERTVVYSEEALPSASLTTAVDEHRRLAAAGAHQPNANTFSNGVEVRPARVEVEVVRTVRTETVDHPQRTDDAQRIPSSGRRRIAAEDWLASTPDAKSKGTGNMFAHVEANPVSGAGAAAQRLPSSTVPLPAHLHSTSSTNYNNGSRSGSALGRRGSHGPAMRDALLLSEPHRSVGVGDAEEEAVIALPPMADPLHNSNGHLVRRASSRGAMREALRSDPLLVSDSRRSSRSPSRSDSRTEQRVAVTTEAIEAVPAVAARMALIAADVQSQQSQHLSWEAAKNVATPQQPQPTNPDEEDRLAHAPTVVVLKRTTSVMSNGSAHRRNLQPAVDGDTIPQQQHKEQSHTSNSRRSSATTSVVVDPATGLPLKTLLEGSASSTKDAKARSLGDSASRADVLGNAVVEMDHAAVEALRLEEENLALERRLLEEKAAMEASARALDEQRASLDSLKALHQNQKADRDVAKTLLERDKLDLQRQHSLHKRQMLAALEDHMAADRDRIEREKARLEAERLQLQKSHTTLAEELREIAIESAVLAEASPSKRSTSSNP